MPGQATNAIQNRLKSHAQGMKWIHAQAAEFDKIYEAARESIMNVIVKHSQKFSAPYSGKYLVALNEKLQDAFKEFEATLRDKMKYSVPYVAQSYYFMALYDLKLNPNDVTASLNRKRINYFLDDSYNHIAGMTQKMQAQEILRLRNLSAKVFREVSLTGKTRKEVSKALMTEAAKITDFQFIDRAGKLWDSKTYFNMLGRTVLLNCSRSTYLDTCAQNNRDVVRVTVSGNPCPDCAVWENRLLSISGKTPGLSTVDYATSKGLFHPNCTHSLVAVPYGGLTAGGVDKKYHSDGRPRKGLNSPQNIQTNTAADWKKYRTAQAISKRKHGPMAEILGKENVNLEGIPSGWRSRIENHLEGLHSQYANKLKSLKMGKHASARGMVYNGEKMYLNREIFSDREKYLQELRSEIKGQFKAKVDAKNIDLYTATHEFGHTVFNTAFATPEQIHELKLIYGDYKALYNKLPVKKQNRMILSKYAARNLDEFFAEAFTQYILKKKPVAVTRQIKKFIDRHYRR